MNSKSRTTAINDNITINIDIYNDKHRFGGGVLRILSALGVLPWAIYIYIYIYI